MKVAIIGAGFAGLATAHFLLASGGVEVTLFEASHVGAGASGVASGLLHPYPGLAARRSKHADEALMIAKQLLRAAEKHTPKVVSIHQGIFRESLTEEQQERLFSHTIDYKDVEQITERLFLIHSGITVVSKNYLEGLTQDILKRGAKLVMHRVHSLEELDAFDQIVITAGNGICSFPECSSLKVKFLKGQALSLSGTPPYDRSYISKGYIAHLGSQNSFEVGSTYERNFANAFPDQNRACELLKEKLSLCPNAEILACKAGIRVCPEGISTPILSQINAKTHVFTGLGSRGLLYHGYYGRKLAQAILFKNKVLQ